MASPKMSLEDILANPTLWGKDFPVLLNSLHSWQSVKAKNVVVFPNRVLGSTPFKTKDAAQPQLEKFRQALKAPRPLVRPRFQPLLKEQVIPAAESNIIQLPEDDSFRVELTAGPAQFLAEGLTIKKVQETLGKPERVTTQVIQSKRDMRPVVLTLYSYANGAVMFGESDLSPTPGVVDRAFIAVAPATSVMFKHGVKK